MPILELVIPKACRCFAPVRVVQPNGIGIIKRLENNLIKSAVMVVAQRDIFSDDPVARYYEEVVKLVRIIAARIAVMPEPLRGRRLNSVGFESEQLSSHRAIERWAFQNYLSIVCLHLDMQDYLNAGISIARKLTPSIWVSGLRTMANNGQTGSTHHFGRSSGTLQGLRSRIRGKRDVISAEGEHWR